MANDAKRVDQLTVTTSLSANDKLVVLANTSGSPVVRTLSASNFVNSTPTKFISNSAPASNTANGVVGQIAYDSGYVYVCVSNNVWGRSQLTLSW